MTYCVGWQTPSEVFLVADAAITSTRAPVSSRTSFGELHVHNSSECVEEAAIKLYRWPTFAVTSAGDLGHILEFIRLIDSYLAASRPPHCAFADAASTISMPGKISPFESVGAFSLDGRPLLMSFNVSGSQRIEWNNSLIHLGSAGSQFRILVDESVGHILRHVESGPDARLACLLAVCQSFTVQNYVLESGFGGTFSGICVDSRGSRWQPDMGYALVDNQSMTLSKPETLPFNRPLSPFIGCIVREDILFVNSPLTGGTIAFASSTHPIEESELRRRVAAGAESAGAAGQNLEFDFVTILSRSSPTAVILETRKKPRTRHLGLGLARQQLGPGLARVDVGFSAELGDSLIARETDSDRRPSFRFVRFQPESPSGVPHGK